MITQLVAAFQLVAITNVSVVDPSSGAIAREQTVVVRGTRIMSAGPAARAVVPPGAEVIAGRGRYLMPGLWDMHVHADVPGGRDLLPLFIAHGVTGVRDMNGTLPVLRGWQRDVAAGALTGPRMVVSGPYVAGQRVPLPHVLARTDVEGRIAVDSLIGLGVDFVKVHNGLSPAAFFSAARQARTKGIPFAGHVFPPVTPLQASDSGMRSEEHLSGFPNECSTDDSVQAAAALPLQRFLLGGCTRAAQREVYQRIARNGTWITPTLIVQQSVVDLRPAIVGGDRVSQFYSDSLLALLRMVMVLPPDPPESARVAGRTLYGKRLQLVVALARAGVPLLVGTDAPLAPALPGEGVHEEMAILVRAGLTPAQALQAATWEPARYFSATDSLGTVAAGRVADLVLLEANPLDNVTNTRRIAAVVANGRVYNRPALDSILIRARVRR